MGDEHQDEVVIVCFGDREWPLWPGDRISFGRGSEDDVVDIVISGDRHLSGEAGRIEALDHGWRLWNLNRWAPIVLTSEGIESTVQGGADTLVTAPATTLSMQLDGQTAVALDVEIVTSEEPSIVDRDPSTGKPRRTSQPLNEKTKYFDALLLLCEPTLRSGRMTSIPTDKDIAAELRLLGLDVAATRVQVEERLRFAKRRLRLLPDQTAYAPRAGNDNRTARVELVETAIRTGAVKPGHLDRIDELRG